MQLTPSNFKKAKKYLLQIARPLDKALYYYHFEEGSKQDVVKELVYYQNEDGGFGRGLEADLRSENSSVVATYHAMDICREVDINYSTRLVRNALHYLHENYDTEKKIWPIITDSVRDVPHPWWWQGDVEKTFNYYILNPTAGILGVLFDYQEYSDNNIIKSCLEETLKRIDISFEGNFYEFRNIQFLVNSRNFDKNLKKKIIEKISPILKEKVVTDDSEWAGFNLNPTNIVFTNSSPFIEVIGVDLLKRNLEFDINNQQEDGSWPLNWSWEEIDPIGWKIAEREWKGHMTLIKLKIFKEFNLIKYQ